MINWKYLLGSAVGLVVLFMVFGLWPVLITAAIGAGTYKVGELNGNSKAIRSRGY